MTPLRAVAALEVLAQQPLSAPQLAVALGVHPRTARRLLHRLRADGYVARSDDRRRVYAPTLRVVSLASQVLDGARLAQLAVPVARRLHVDTGLGAHLMVPSYRSALCIVHGGDGPPALEELVPAHATAPGKVLLSFRQAWRDSLLAAPLERFTPRTVTSPSRLRAEAAQIRAQGFATEDGEHRPGIGGAAAPVFGAGGEAIAALGVCGPRRTDDVAAVVVRAAAGLSAAVAAA